MYIFGDTYFQGAVLKNVFQIVFLLVITSEFLILVFTSWNNHKSSGKKSKSDRGSMLFIMFGYWLSILMNPICIHAFPVIMPAFMFWVGIILAIWGVILRVYSVWTLGKFFTLAVQVGSEQKIVQEGPYRLLRHPAYTRKPFIADWDCSVIPITMGCCCNLADYSCCIWLSNQNGRKHPRKKLWFTVSGL